MKRAGTRNIFFFFTWPKSTFLSLKKESVFGQGEHVDVHLLLLRVLVDRKGPLASRKRQIN